MPLAVDAAALAAGLSLLDGDERRRADRFGREQDRRTFVIARARLRRILAAALDLAPQALRFTYGPAGKPALVDDANLHFSVAHAGDEGMIAVSRAGPVGIDIEIERDVPESTAIAEALFGPPERATLAAAPAALRAATFLRLWTGKEALLKAFGTGFAGAVAHRAHGDGWTVHPVEAPTGYVAALARPRGDHPVVTHH